MPQEYDSEHRKTAEEREPRIDTSPLLRKGGYQKLDSHAVTLWRTVGGFWAGLFWLTALIGGLWLWLYTPFPRSIVVIGWLAMTLFFMLSLWLPRKRYETCSFRLTDRVFEIRSGIIWKSSVMIPLTRLQHVDLSSGPFERRLGLSTLEIHTAGTSNASHKLSGLGEKTGLQLRRELISAADLAQEAFEATQER